MSAGSARASGDPEDVRYFTVEEANRTLPLVARIVGDIVEAHAPLQEKLEEFQRLLSTTGPGDDRTPLEELREEINRESDRINDFVGELEEIGCLFKGFDGGLVDFYSRYAGRSIFLCWMLGEESVAHWHELEGGFAGRQPLTPSVVSEIRKDSEGEA